MALLLSRPGSPSRIVELAKRIAFRSKWLNALSRPRYAFGLEPAQLAWLTIKIDRTRRANTNHGAIVEVGVARGMTSVFLLEHMKRTADKRPYYCIDTFAGFLDKDVAYEATERGKDRSQLRGFAYNSKQVFEQNLRRAGYSNVVVVSSDAAQVDFSMMFPIDVILLDVDLYLPTKAVLANASRYLNGRSYIMVDDCKPNTQWDGADQAYDEFVHLHGSTRLIVGTRGGIWEKG